MWMPNKNGGECPAESESLAETQPTPFRQVYGFILQAVKGDKATADAIFEEFILLENYPKSSCQFHGVASTRIKRAHLTAT
jgi:hypothetical protein